MTDNTRIAGSKAAEHIPSHSQTTRLVVWKWISYILTGTLPVGPYGASRPAGPTRWRRWFTVADLGRPSSGRTRAWWGLGVLLNWASAVCIYIAVLAGFDRSTRVVIFGALGFAVCVFRGICDLRERDTRDELRDKASGLQSTKRRLSVRRLVYVALDSILATFATTIVCVVVVLAFWR